MMTEECDKQRVDSAEKELIEVVEAYNSFTSSLLFERALRYTLDKLPLRIRAETAERALNHFREKWPQFFDEKGEFISK